MTSTQILIIIGLVVAAYAFFRIRSVLRKQAVVEEVEDYQRRNEIRQLQEELGRLKTETTRETKVYKDAKEAYDAKYRKTPPVTGSGSNNDGSKS